MPQEFRASLTASIPMGSDAMNAMPEISKALETAKAALEKIGGLTVATNTAVVNSRGPRAKAAPAAAEPAAGGGEGDGETLTHVEGGNVHAATWAPQASKAAERKRGVWGKRWAVRVE